MQNPAVSRPQPKLVRLILDPFRKFINTQVSSGIVLLAALVAALVWANSPWAESYHHFWEMPIGINYGDFKLEHTLHFWINDGLMTIFFFVVGLEIKREIMIGELASPRKAALPIFAAMGGMVVPALVYAAFNYSGEAASGWGIPMATDIAFALGVLNLLGNRVPLSLKVFLAALAIVDDMGAVILIAVFYTADLSVMALLIGLGFYILLWILNLLSIRHLLLYVIFGVALWFALLESGIHPTIAGVLAATTIPARPRIRNRDFIEINEEMLERYKGADNVENADEAAEIRQEAVQVIEENCERIQTTLQRLEHNLHIYVSFLIMPLFALANAGVPINLELASHLTDPIGYGIWMGLAAGKFIGIGLFVYLAVRLGIASLPTGAKWLHVLGVAFLGGIGFTMSIFIANLAYTNPAFLPEAKLAILFGSFLSATLGIILLNIAHKRSKKLREEVQTDLSPA